ncbi:hypothetical protein L2W58_03945 [Dethiosulfovibrio sp. F2B]|uniref:hypothetical protein n=1 Tax=Dethiosulfovibrio faecalis TaxID=2720018 RepID=UPI001F39DBCA|nr:hypothetical protein [Dethiosulfovibrio faecalis]MCF4150945.1 hypothetical protein [Dethiosulfovibrio faecalis]
MICPIKRWTLFISIFAFFAFSGLSEAASLDAVFPANNASDVEPGTITLTWEAMDNATYSLSFGTGAGSMSPISLRDNSLPMADVSAASGTSYYWQVSGTSASGDVVQSSVWRFTTAELEAGELEAVYPTDKGTSIPYGKVTLRWKSSLPNMYFDLYFGKDASSSEKIASNLQDPLFDVQVSEGREYLWWVVAKNSEGLEASSSIWSFKTKGDDSIGGGCNLSSLKHGMVLMLPLLFFR